MFQLRAENSHHLMSKPSVEGFPVFCFMLPYLRRNGILTSLRGFSNDSSAYYFSLIALFLRKLEGTILYDQVQF